jgi:outer membrane lipoprotein carrier protein
MLASVSAMRSLRKKTVRPGLVEGRTAIGAGLSSRCSWFDKLTTNGLVRTIRTFGLGAGFAFASLAAHASAVDQLRSFLSQAQTARGEFTQRVTSRAGATAQNSSGRFVFQRPGKFRWIYDKPYEQIIVADGERLFLFDKDLNQVTVKKLAGAIPASPASILFGSNQFEKDFEVSDAGSRDGLEWIVAMPRAKDSPFDRIEIGFRDGLPGAMQLTDGFGQVSLLRFAKVERNARVDADAFRFTPPKGADVLEDR